MPEESPSPSNNPLRDFLRRPVTGAQLLRFREVAHEQMMALWNAVDAMESRLSQLAPVTMHDDIVQQTITAMERNLGDMIRVKADLRVGRVALVSQLGEAAADSLLKQEDGSLASAVSLQGTKGIVVARDMGSKQILVRLLFRPAMLMLFYEDEVEVVEGGRALGTFNPHDSEE